jgi:hypothetical protein
VYFTWWFYAFVHVAGRLLWWIASNWIGLFIIRRSKFFVMEPRPQFAVTECLHFLPILPFCKLCALTWKCIVMCLVYHATNDFTLSGCSESLIRFSYTITLYNHHFVIIPLAPSSAAVRLRLLSSITVIPRLTSESNPLWYICFRCYSMNLLL